MKAFVAREYGSPDVLKFEEVPRPVPAPGEILIKIQAASLNAADWHLLRADPFLVRLLFGFSKPKYEILGADMAGRVEAVGKDVTRFKPGDEVYGCLSRYRWGAFAEYVCARQEDLVEKPARLSFEEAAAVPLAAMTALQGLRDAGRIKAGQKVLINGASGGVGTFAVQIAKAFGAEVTAVCSARNLELARSIGADHVIDYGQEDFTKNGQHYDLILAANGYQPIGAYKQSLASGGICAMAGGAGKQMAEGIFQGPFRSLFGDKKLRWVDMKANDRDLALLSELIQKEKIKPVIDRRYPLERLPEALRYLEEGHAQGKIVITQAQG
jgi:NADPH:quinone reductase-like Zn-dependent oxidoreductase